MSASRFPAPSADYLKTYSLNREPFADGPDGRFFYGGSTLMQRLDLLVHLTQFGDSVVLVSGPEGSGKTTLLGRFVAQANRHWRLCLIHAQEFADFGRRLADALAIGDTLDEQQIVARWASQSDASQLLVIVIDDAQLLQPDAVAKLCDLLSLPESERVRLILFGTPQAQQAIKQSLEQRQAPCTAQLLEIPKLSEEETAAYLMYRLAVAGYSGESPFTATEVRAICKAADGRPADINRLAHEALRERQIRSPSKPPGTNVARSGRGLTWGVASVVVVLAAVYLGWERLRPADSGDAGESVPLALPQAEPLPRTPPAAVAPAVDDAAAPTAREQAQAPEPALQTNPEAQTQVPPPAPAPAPVTPTVGEVTTPAIPPPAASADERPEPEAPALAPPRPAPVTPAAPAGMQAGPTGAPAAPEPTTTPPPAAPARSAAPPPAETEKPATAAAHGPHREAWLLEQPGNRYTLQLLGSRHQQPILDYIRGNKLDPERCAYYRGSFKGGEWYVLVYGVFPDRATALAARDALPARVQKEKPWPRSFASVQETIREQQ